MKYAILCNRTMQPLRRFFFPSHLWHGVFSWHFFKTKPFSPKTFAFENRWKNRALKWKTPQFWWIIVESVLASEEGKQHKAWECHLLVALWTSEWAVLSSVPQHCCHLLQPGQQHWPLQSTAMLHIYCQAMSLSWSSLFRFFDCFGFISCFHCLRFFKFLVLETNKFF